MHDFLTHLRIDELFGYITHDIELDHRDNLTVLTGVNGSGKTHVLRLLQDLASLEPINLIRSPCESAELTYRSGKTLKYEHIEPDIIKLTAVANGTSLGDLIIRELPDRLDQVVPPFMERLDDDTWIDDRDGEVISTDEVRLRFAPSLGQQERRFEVLGEPKYELEYWRRAFSGPAPPTFIATRRLDTRVVQPRARAVRGERARIRQYVDLVAEQVREARRQSLMVSQRADRQFAARALDRAHATVNEAELRKRYEQLAQLNQDLNSNGLTEPSMGIAFPGQHQRTNPTERRIISVFLEDWSAKLSALQSVHRKIELLRATVEHKLVDKQMAVQDGHLVFMNRVTGDSIRVDSLSSGEQHLLALFTMLIFQRNPRDSRSYRRARDFAPCCLEACIPR